MSTTVQVPGGFEVTSNSETAEEMVAALTPKKDDGKEPRVIMDKGKPVPQEPDKAPLSKAASELGKAGGKAAAEARKEKAQSAVDDLEKAAEKKMAKDAKVEPEPKTEAKEGKAEPDEAADGDDPDKPEGKPRHDAKARIAQLARERAEERAARLAAEAELARLRQPEKTEPAPEPGGRPKREQFASEDEYIEAVADWKAEERVQRARREDAVQRMRHERSAKFRERVAADPEFVNTVDPRLLEMTPAHMLEPGQPLGPDNVIAEALVTSEWAVELFHYLTEHPEEVVRLIQLPNGFEIGRAIGRLEDKLASKPAPKAEPEPERASAAPPPLRPVTPSSVPSDPDITGEMDFDTYIKRRSAKRA